MPTIRAFISSKLWLLFQNKLSQEPKASDDFAIVIRRAEDDQAMINDIKLRAFTSGYKSGEIGAKHGTIFGSLFKRRKIRAEFKTEYGELKP